MELLNDDLQDFLRQDFGSLEGSHWLATRIETGGGGDCFFHAVGSIFERMLFAPHSQMEASHVLRNFSRSDFRQGKQHLVQKMRRLTAARIHKMVPEEFLNFVITLLQQYNANVWHDHHWNPQTVLEDTGFAALLGATLVLAVANADDHAANLVVKYQQNTNTEHLAVIEDGFAHLATLRHQL